MTIPTVAKRTDTERTQYTESSTRDARTAQFGVIATPPGAQPARHSPRGVYSNGKKVYRCNEHILNGTSTGGAKLMFARRQQLDRSYTIYTGARVAFDSETANFRRVPAPGNARSRTASLACNKCKSPWDRPGGKEEKE